MAERAYTTSDHKTTVICPQCDKSKTVDVSKLVCTNKTIRIKAACSCGHKWTLELEKRRLYRKAVNLAGTYEHIKKGKVIDRGSMKVVDLSFNGVKIKLNVERDFQTGDQLDIEFHLDDSKRTPKKKRISVRNISGPYIGASFRPDEAYDSVLGFYLLNDSPTVPDRRANDDRKSGVAYQKINTQPSKIRDEKKRKTVQSPERKIEPIDEPEVCKDLFEKSPNEFAEKRKHPRLEFHCSGMALGREVLVRDISEGGLFIEMEEIPGFFGIGRVVNVNLFLPTESEKLNLKAKFVSQTKKGFGCKYYEISQYNRWAIKNCFDEFKNTLPVRGPD